MKAVVVPQTGGPDVLELREVPAPKPGEGDRPATDLAQPEHAGVEA